MPSRIAQARIVLEDGTQLKQWTSYSIDSDFLTPTDGWSFTVGDEKLHTNKAAYALLQPDVRVDIWVDESQVLAGVIDSVDFQSSVDGGTVCTVSGRDIMRTLCKSNVWPGLVIKDLTLAQMVEKVLSTYYPETPPQVFYDDKANRQVVGLTGKFTPKDRSAKQKALIERSAAHPNEGAFEFISRNLRRHGLWIWATADGNMVISGPEYDQAPAYQIVRKRGVKGAQWGNASYKWDRTNVPSFIQVRGKSTSKEWEKTEVFGSAADPNAYHGTPGIKYYNGVIEPAYVQHDEAKDADQCKAYALQELTRLKQNERVYTVTAKGHHDDVTGNIFAVNTIATVEDEFTGVSENMFVSGRTFRKDNSGGTTTELRCVPLGSIQFSDVDWAG